MDYIKETLFCPFCAAEIQDWATKDLIGNGDMFDMRTVVNILNSREYNKHIRIYSRCGNCNKLVSLNINNEYFSL